MSPAVTVVLPTPEWVPDIRSAGTTSVSDAGTLFESGWACDDGDDVDDIGISYVYIPTNAMARPFAAAMTAVTAAMAKSATDSTAATEKTDTMAAAVEMYVPQQINRPHGAKERASGGGSSADGPTE